MDLPKLFSFVAGYPVPYTGFASIGTGARYPVPYTGFASMGTSAGYPVPYTGFASIGTGAGYPVPFVGIGSGIPENSAPSTQYLVIMHSMPKLIFVVVNRFS